MAGVLHRPPSPAAPSRQDRDPDTFYLYRVDVRRVVSGLLGPRAVLVSATVPESLPPRCGWADVTPVDVGHPFDYRGQVSRLAVSTHDGRKSPRGESAASREARMLARAAELEEFIGDGGPLVLCSSHRDVAMLLRVLTPRLSARGLLVLHQPDAEGSEAAGPAVAQFRSAGNEGRGAVLFGTDSLATGLDVPGAALRRVALWSLPLDYRSVLDDQLQRMFPGRGVSWQGRPAPGSYKGGAEHRAPDPQHGRLRRGAVV